ncbi:MAG: GNAT family N-acetyltransferase [Janthinobacterium lividum]
MVKPCFIQAARATDLPFVYAGELDYIQQIEPQQEAQWKDAMIAHLRQWTANLTRMFVVEQENTVVGYCFWEIHGDTAVLASIHVISGKRRSGLGRLLLMKFLNDARAQGFNALLLAVKENNPARSLYEQSGFHHTRDEQGYRHYAHAAVEPRSAPGNRFE